MVNPVAAGFVAGGVLARNSGPKAVLGGGLAFAAFSAAIDLFLRREPAECVFVRSPVISLNLKLFLVAMTDLDGFTLRTLYSPGHTSLTACFINNYP